MQDVERLRRVVDGLMDRLEAVEQIEGADMRAQVGEYALRALLEEAGQLSTAARATFISAYRDRFLDS